MASGGTVWARIPFELSVMKREASHWSIQATWERFLNLRGKNKFNRIMDLYTSISGFIL